MSQQQQTDDSYMIFLTIFSKLANVAQVLIVATLSKMSDNDLQKLFYNQKPEYIRNMMYVLITYDVSVGQQVKQEKNDFFSSVESKIPSFALYLMLSLVLFMKISQKDIILDKSDNLYMLVSSLSFVTFVRFFQIAMHYTGLEFFGEEEEENGKIKLQ